MGIGHQAIIRGVFWMPVSFTVTNQPPEQVELDGTALPLVELFQYYTQAKDGRHYPLFRHQAEVFNLLMQDKEIFLVAGTAAGKTLAIAVPIFYKLATGRIRKALFMYPTVALMEDQRRVMDELARLTRLEVGQLQGGMSRTELIASLNKPVILATPDEVYWFFRKNVKYSGLLIYGLALVDEFVLDEAHLFNGLMLQNLTHLKRRIQLLGARLGKHSRWHILTATPTPELRSLTGGVEVRGKSKCGDVQVLFLEPAGKKYAEHQDKLLAAVESAVVGGAQKVLLVLNSASLAHRIFEEVRSKSQPDLPPELEWKFGRVPWGKLRIWLEQEGIEREMVEEIEKWLRREEPFFLKDLPEGTQVAIPIEVLISKLTRLFEIQSWSLKRLVYSVAREEQDSLFESVERKLSGKGRFLNLLWATVSRSVKSRSDAEVVAGALDTWVSNFQTALERTWTTDSLTLTALAFTEITASLREVGINFELASKITDYLKHSIELPEEAAAKLRTSPQKLSERYIAFSWLEWLIKSQSRRESLMMRIQEALRERRIEVETRHIAVWGETGIPTVIYTGKMSKTDRRGLIEAFAILPRAILISTPAVEVGVDFAADMLVTEQCDGNGFLQRFGRVGRRPGIQSRVIVLIRDGETYVKLYQRYRPEMTREEFSALIASPVDGLFGNRLYTEGSVLLDATHWLINAQLGEIGDWLNRGIFTEKEPAELAQDLRKSGLTFAYGLRGTLPEVSLRGGTGGGEPFYILRKIPNTRLLPSDSPFEMARADMGFLEFLWRKMSWQAIAVDVTVTLESSRALFWGQAGRWRVRACHGIAADYTRLFHPAIRTNLRELKAAVTENLAGLLERLRPHATNPKVRPILRVGEALPLFFTPYACFILGQGDVHLLRLDQEGIIEAVEDHLGNPLVLPDQLWLILYGSTREEAVSLLKEVSALNLEEAIYDWQTLEVQGNRLIGPVLLERVTGACFDIYQRLVKHVSG